MDACRRVCRPRISKFRNPAVWPEALDGEGALRVRRLLRSFSGIRSRALTLANQAMAVNVGTVADDASDRI